MKKGLAGDQFYIIEEDTVAVNNLLWKSKMHDFFTIHQVYKAKNRVFDSTYKLNDIWYSYNNDKEPVDQTAVERLRLNDSKSFVDIAKEYCELMKNPMLIWMCDERERSVNAIEKTYPFISDAWSILKEDGFKKAKYRLGVIKEAMVINNNESDNNKKVKGLLGL